jgi:hypothetical protein
MCFGGLSGVARVFSKVMGVLVRHWREQGIRMLAYLDDLLFVASSVAEANKIPRTLIADTKRAHMNIKYGKSSLSPSTCIAHLGFDIDTTKGMFTVPSKRWRSAQRWIESMLGGRARTNTAREITSVT